jgi:transcriptional regulator with XRE-family HTH domain
MAESAKATFGERLQMVRKTYGMLLGEQKFPRSAFAALLGIPHMSYNRYERDEAEPLVSFVCKVRDLTGVSLDYLLGYDTPGISDLERYDRACSASAGQRLRYIREFVTPDVSRFARLMGVRASRYLRWEADIEAMPIEKMEEFARRFGVSVDYLARGLPVGIAPEPLAKLLKEHPDLWHSPAGEQENPGSDVPDADPWEAASEAMDRTDQSLSGASQVTDDPSATPGNRA